MIEVGIVLRLVDFIRISVSNHATSETGFFIAFPGCKIILTEENVI
jgi:hypothetical protein